MAAFSSRRSWAIEVSRQGAALGHLPLVVGLHHGGDQAFDGSAVQDTLTTSVRRLISRWIRSSGLEDQTFRPWDLGEGRRRPGGPLLASVSMVATSGNWPSRVATIRSNSSPDRGPRRRWAKIVWMAPMTMWVLFRFTRARTSIQRCALARPSP